MHAVSFDLSGRTALVTGSSQGIGYSLATGLAAAGARVVLNGRDETRLDRAARNLRDLGHTVETLPFDATDVDAVRQAIDRFEAETGAMDILVNNAGRQIRGPLEDFAPSDFDALMKLNVNAVFYVAQAVARHMIPRKAGKIINIASVQTALARQTIAPYTASKGAVANLTKGMAADWARYGINANAIAPGYFDTPLSAALVADPDFTAWVEARTPAGRWGQLHELQGACVFLASEAASFVHGQTLFVDGGMSVSL